jgi:hypothetical protein
VSEPFIRRIELRAFEGSVTASVQDFQHHFEVTIRHDGAVVTGIEPRAIRWPWSVCADAGAELQELVGTPIGIEPHIRGADRHCTHQLDIASLAIRFGGLGLNHRIFDITITGWSEPGATAELMRDDGFRLSWTYDRLTIASPPPFAGQSITHGFASWVRQALDPDTAEAALILRRACWVAPARGLDLDQLDVIAESGISVGSCYATQPERLQIAHRNKGMAKVVQFPSSQ